MVHEVSRARTLQRQESLHGLLVVSVQRDEPVGLVARPLERMDAVWWAVRQTKQALIPDVAQLLVFATCLDELDRFLSAIRAKPSVHF